MLRVLKSLVVYSCVLALSTATAFGCADCDFLPGTQTLVCTDNPATSGWTLCRNFTRFCIFFGPSCSTKPTAFNKTVVAFFETGSNLTEFTPRIISASGLDGVRNALASQLGAAPSSVQLKGWGFFATDGDLDGFRDEAFSTDSFGVLLRMRVEPLTTTLSVCTYEHGGPLKVVAKTSVPPGDVLLVHVPAMNKNVVMSIRITPATPEEWSETLVPDQIQLKTEAESLLAEPRYSFGPDFAPGSCDP